MLFGLIDRTTSAGVLKVALDQSMQRSRISADRVAQASVNNADGFSLTGQAGSAVAGQNNVNIEEEMMAQGDENLRFLTTAKLLEKTYQSLRTAIKGSAS